MGSKKETAPQCGISITGDNCGIVAGGNVIIHQGLLPAPKERPVVPVTEEHISEEQRVVLQKLVDDVVNLEAVARKMPKNYATVWKSLNRHCQASSYKLIRREDYPKAEKYLRAWIGRLSSTKTARKKDENWRKRKLAFIHTNCKQYDLEPRMREYMLQKFNAASLKELSDDDLTKVYNVVNRWKNA